MEAEFQSASVGSNNSDPNIFTRAEESSGQAKATRAPPAGHAAPQFAALEASVDAFGLPVQLEAAGLVEVGDVELVVSKGVFNMCVDKP
jgi:hypothetical protein